ncbi:MAG: cytidylate kinase-like family protein [Treponema sp.]|nr:cytidylate kinase-like family protein [Treponema sp.]MBR4463749.1 cytidylate kinase-like family protein [Treponema sp.]
MKKIITISREYGSGGQVIGHLVAKELGYDFYDKELIDLAAQESGLSPDFIEKNEQNLSSAWLYNLLVGTSYAGVSTGTSGHTMATHTPVMPLADQVFNAQRKSILAIAKKSPCVIVGRCADYILSTSDEIDQKELLNVFVYADLNDKVRRAIEQYNIPEKDAKKFILQANKRRANHYNTFTENIWGDRKNYDLLINSSSLGLEESARFIVEFAKKA